MSAIKPKSRALLLVLALGGLAVLAGVRSRVFMAQATSCQQTNSCPSAIPPQFFIVNDAQGPNDQPGQKDLSRLGRWNHPVGDALHGYLDIFMSWDEINPQSQSFDACALLDSNGDTNADFAICPQIKGG